MANASAKKLVKRNALVLRNALIGAAVAFVCTRFLTSCLHSSSDVLWNWFWNLLVKKLIIGIKEEKVSCWLKCVDWPCVCIKLIHLLGLYFFESSSGGLYSIIIYLVINGACLGFFKISSTPKFDSEGSLSDPGQDLSQKGLMDFVWDFLYVTWFCQLATLLSPWLWLLMLVVCFYVIFQTDICFTHKLIYVFDSDTYRSRCQSTAHSSFMAWRNLWAV